MERFQMQNHSVLRNLLQSHSSLNNHKKFPSLEWLTKRSVYRKIKVPWTFWYYRRFASSSSKVIAVMRKPRAEQCIEVIDGFLFGNACRFFSFRERGRWSFGGRPKINRHITRREPWWVENRAEPVTQLDQTSPFQHTTFSVICTGWQQVCFQSKQRQHAYYFDHQELIRKGWRELFLMEAKRINTTK